LKVVSQSPKYVLGWSFWSCDVKVAFNNIGGQAILVHWTGWLIDTVTGFWENFNNRFLFL